MFWNPFRSSSRGLTSPGRERGSAGSHYPPTVAYYPRSQGAVDEMVRRVFNVKDADEITDGQALKIQSVDFNIAANTKAHHTDEFEITKEKQAGILHGNPRQLVVRRGQPFDVKVTFSRRYDDKKDDLRLIFEFGDNPLPGKGSLVELILSDEDHPNEWGAKVKKTDGGITEVTIFTPSVCPVGKWRLKIDIIRQDDKTKKSLFRYTHPLPIYILFNPWCKHDAVYMESEDGKAEYVLNETGKIYVGNHKNVCGKPWNFSQFDGVVLDCAIKVLDQSKMPVIARGDPINVVRKLTAVANVEDDDGILHGNWTGNYVGGRSPLEWTGSEAIIEQFYRTGKPVKFGQCWVFSGIMTSLCRALGFPTRSVTNFQSACDSDGSLTIDMYWNEKGEPEEKMSEDSIWNFHVWNEVWMTRPDLPAGYGGWQAIDGTPQELSDGVYRCGPASVKAIREGDVHLPYDTAFLFAEVNADRIDYAMGEDKTWKKSWKKDVVGKFISTKKCGSLCGVVNAAMDRFDPDRDDVTEGYKFGEGSSSERAAVLRAIRTGSKRKEIYEDHGTEDVAFDLVDKDIHYMGKDFDVVAKMENKSGKERNIVIHLMASVVRYTGEVESKIKAETFHVKLAKKECKEVVMKVTTRDYLYKLVDHAQGRISCQANVDETDQVYTEVDTFRLVKPTLDIKVPSEVKLGQSVEVEVSFLNSLPQTLTDCVLTVEGPGLQKPTDFQLQNLPPNGTLRARVRLTPFRAGERQLLVSFNSRQMKSVDGFATLVVKP
ncbi:hemocyte protein-glutamine gamma-glutamyltransferase-like [Liolophura sinensis]|uniref:hemocyte protein-glutamine gamma-glutamyltransferase-like n=1 Tax=Liolophura sinensis TaxID=3198878 RepID=UPI0031589FFD